MTNNTRALARHNCHPELDSGSYQRYEREFNVGQMLKRVQHDSKRDNPIKNLTSYRLNDLVTCAGQGASLIGLRAYGRAAFTMAEILLSLTIIGVVAAITLPSLTGNINERTWNTQRKALYARFSQAIALMPALNGYGTITTGEDGSVTSDNVAETFVTDGLAKVLKVNNICDSEHLQDCGLAGKITLANGSTRSLPKTMDELNPLMKTILGFDTKAAAFETQNGESIAVFYNPNCTSDMQETDTFYSQSKMCANFVYDLNGSKGPNTFGKDLGIMTALYASDSVVVAPLATTNDSASSEKIKMSTSINKKCTAIDADSRLPNKEELASLFYNRDLVTFNYDSETYVGDFWAAPVQPTSDTAWCLRLSSGEWLFGCTAGHGRVRCVKR